MQVILLEKIDNLGTLGELVTVRPGYARNFLLPQGKAERATPANIEAFEARRAELERQQAAALAEARALGTKLDGLRVSVSASVGSEGKLFGSVGTDEITHAVNEAAGVDIEKRAVRLPEGPLRNVGEHPVSLHLHTDVDVDIIVDVVGEEA